MGKQSQQGDKRPEQVTFEGDPSRPDYLSYKEMMLAMLRHAPTNTGWFSVLVTFLLFLCGFIVCSIVFNLMTH